MGANTLRSRRFASAPGSAEVPNGPLTARHFLPVSEGEGGEPVSPFRASFLFQHVHDILSGTDQVVLLLERDQVGMRTLATFAKTTLIGGLLIILPLYVSLLLLVKAASGLLALLQPVTNAIPTSLEYREALAVILLIAVCFLVGAIARTGPGFRAKNAFERAVLERLPGYALLRGFAGRLTGSVEEPTFAPALAEIEEALVPALVIEELADGSFTVFVPSIPTPMAGALYILPPERVHLVDVPMTVALKVFSKWGAGAGEFVRAMKATGIAKPQTPQTTRIGAEDAAHHANVNP